MPPPAPLPTHILRFHSSEVKVVAVSQDNERLLSGDQSGVVVVTSTRTLRAIATWKAHKDGLLGIEEWDQNIITHARDNKLHVWEAVCEPTQTLGDAALRLDLPSPKLLYSLDVNALNFCRFSLLKQVSDPASASKGSSSQSQSKQRALLAVPNLVESSLVDVWELPSCARLHAAIGKMQRNVLLGSDGRGDDSTGIVMSLHLFEDATSSSQKALSLLAAYESGDVMLLRYAGEQTQKSINGQGWVCMWRTKQHKESIMAMAVSPDNTFALTVSADYFVVRYNMQSENEIDQFRQFTIKQPGNACVEIRYDGRVCAVGGWDGRVRLFATKNMKSLGTLSHHEKMCKALAFAHKQLDLPLCDEDDEMTDEEKAARERWLVAGSEDHRITVWRLMNFDK